MKFLYVPWRNKYVKDIRKTKQENASEMDCVFCQQINSSEDRKHFILGRYKYNVIFLNLHPYNTGHLLIIPIKHVQNLYNLNHDELNELVYLESESTKILENQMKCDGINIGMNLGKAAGAGIPSHLHKHILPRWNGDTNFLPLLAETKTISIDLNKVYEDLKPHFEVVRNEPTR